jgi:hypothetical protein
MAGNDSGPAVRQGARAAFAHGDRIRITGGTLAGLTGVVARPPGSADCVLEIDGWPPGIYLMVCGTSIDLLEREVMTV